jgi:hypothetical protein
MIGYARGGAMQVYHGIERVIVDGAMSEPTKIRVEESADLE